MSESLVWRSAAVSDRLRLAYDTFQEVFPPNPIKYGVLTSYGENGKKNVSTKDLTDTGQEASKAWPTILANHFRVEDEGRVGYLSGTRSGTHVGAIDVDYHVFGGMTEEVVREVVDAALAEQLTPLLERSTSGGWHIWLWSAAALPYEDVRNVLKHIVQQADVGVLETYPMGGAGAKGRWIFMPYAGAASRDDGLGRTYLETLDGNAISIDKLLETVRAAASPRRIWEKLSSEYRAEQKKFAETAIEPGELSDAALEQLRQSVMKPPTGFDRHHSVFAFINIAERAGGGAGLDMKEFLQTPEVWKLWVRGRAGERSIDEWREELDRIWLTVQSASDTESSRYGIPFLTEMGWEVPELERRVESLGASKGWTKASDDDLAARWLHGQLESMGKPLAVEAGTPFTWKDGTWTPMQSVEEAVGHAVENVLRPAGAKINQDQVRGRVQWMLRQVSPKRLLSQASPHHLAVENGVIDLRNGQLSKHDPSVVTIGRAPVIWGRLREEEEQELLKPMRSFLKDAMNPPENPLPGGLMKVLVEDYFRAWAWAIDPAKRGRFFMDFHGPTSTGKSTAVRAALRVLGDVSMDPLGLWTSLDADSLDLQEFSVALIGRQGVHFDDLSLTGDKRGDRRTINFFKKVAGGTTLAINRKFQPTENAHIHARIIVSTNTIMSGSTGEDTAALNMRAWRIGFFGQAVDRTKQRPNYESDLLPSNAHKLAFLRTLVRYWQEFDSLGGVRTAHSVKAQKKVFEEYEHHQHPELTFLQTRCVRGRAEDTVTTSMLVEAYNDWARRNNERLHDTRTWGAAMKVMINTLWGQGWRIKPAVFKSKGATVRGYSGLHLQYGGMSVQWDDE